MLRFTLQNICLIVLALPLSAAEVPKPLSGWLPSKDCSLALRDGQFVVSSTGDDPFLVAQDLNEARGKKGPFTVELLMALNSSGRAQIYWASAALPHSFSAASASTFDVVHDNAWHAYSVKLDTPDLGGLRLDPSTAPGEIRLSSVRLCDNTSRLVKEWKLGTGGPPTAFPNANGNAQIRAKFKDSDIVITTTQRLAGAIHSLTWGGQEFINSFDHGRQLQSASNLDCGTRLSAETFNPTEAGARDDGIGPFSSSRLLEISALGAELKSKTQMAFWLHPGEKSGGEPAKNTSALSQHLLSKRVHIGHKKWLNVIEYDVTFTLPDERHNVGVFEALTGYMPLEFAIFQTANPLNGKLLPLTDGPGEQLLPLIFSTSDKRHAMGVFAPAQQPGGRPEVRYGRFKFSAEKVVKWNCVYRLKDANGIKPGDISFQVFVAVGSLDDVTNALQALFKEF